MVCVDTCIFIAIYRQPRSALSVKMNFLADQRRAAICGQVWVELVGGFRNVENRKYVRDRLMEYVWLDTTRQTFELAAEWAARFKGIGAGDAIIAATAHLHNVPLFTVDRSFAALRDEGLRLFETS